MPQANDSSRFEKYAAMQLWLRGCVLAGGIGLLVAVVLSVNLYQTHQKLVLDVPPERINPNSAAIASLVRLPGIGVARAMDIIHYRQQQDGLVYDSADDLEQIRGIGPKTASKLAPWLVFPGE